MSSFSSVPDAALLPKKLYKQICSFFEEPANQQACDAVFKGVNLAQNTYRREPTPIDIYYSTIDYAFMQYGLMTLKVLEHIKIANQSDFIFVLDQLIRSRVITLSEFDDYSLVLEARGIDEIMAIMTLKPFQGIQIDSEIN